MKMRIMTIVGCILAVAITTFAYCNEVTAFYRSSFIDDNRNVKVCVYEFAGKSYFHSVGTFNMCPQSIRVCQRF